MNTNVWIAQQLLIIPLRGIIQLDGIIGTENRDSGEWAPNGPYWDESMTELAESWPSAETFCQYPVSAT